MTPRLKLLSFLLALSLIYAVYDYIDRNNIGKPSKKEKVRKQKRARTAGVTVGNKVRKVIAAQKKAKEKENKRKKIGKEFTGDFTQISSDFSSIEGWSRNPFVDVYEPVIATEPKESPKKNQLPEKKAEVKLESKSFELSSIDRLVIETAVRMGDKAFVTINGQTYSEGDLINDALIEKIENEEVTFRVGKTKIIKDVGI
tara:strand:+ start:3255 stop:3854 length:600 start_codon:yes stop_codon:yes gene_type:complete